MDILVVNLNDMCDCFLSTCILRGLRKKYKKQNLNTDCLVSNKASASVFKHNKHIRHTFLSSNISKHNFQKYNLLINLSLDPLPDIKADKIFGVNYMDQYNDYYIDVLFGDKKIKKNIYQIYYKLAGLKWRGEGCELFYRPKYKNNKDMTGMAIANANLRRYITKKLELDEGTISNVQYCHNLFKKIDQINRYNSIITDDLFTMYVAVFLRKYVCFLKTTSYNTNIELFNNGKVIPVPAKFI